MGAIVGKDSKMHRGFLQPGELQAGIDRVLLAGITSQRFLVGLRKALDYGATTVR